MFNHCLFVDICMLCLPLFAVLDAPDAILIEPDVSSITVSWESPEGNYTGFEVDCLANSDGAVNQSTNEVEESGGTYTSECEGVTSGVEYTVTVTTLHDGHAMRSEGTTNYTITGRWSVY